MDETVAAAGTTEVSAAATIEAGTILGEDGQSKAAAEVAVEKPKEGAVTDEAKKAADEQAAKAKAETDAKAAIVPERYELKLPEGTIVDDVLMGEATALFKEDKLSNERAQKYAELSLKSVGVLVQKQAAEFRAKVDGWGNELKEAKDLQGTIEIQGKPVPKIDALVSDARKVLFAGVKDPKDVKRLQDALNESGLGNHPLLVRALASFAEFVGDDNMVIGRGGASTPTDTAHRLYPNNP